jgi:hypothetical protein
MTAPNETDYQRRCADLLRRIEAEQPEFLRAADEVDTTLRDWMLSLSPLERLEAMKSMGALRELGEDARRWRATCSRAISDSTEVLLNREAVSGKTIQICRQRGYNTWRAISTRPIHHGSVPIA